MTFQTSRAIHTLTALLCTIAMVPAHAQTRLEQLREQTEDIKNFVDADNAKSATCARYEGTVVKPVTFDVLSQTLPKAITKGEFETSAQYQARIASTGTRPLPASAIIVLPADRTYASYAADSTTMTISSGAFDVGSFSEDTAADVSASFAIGDRDGKGTPVPVTVRETVTGTYNAQNLMGATFRVSDITRETKALYLTTKDLFPFAKRDTSPVMLFDVPLAGARLMKQTFKVALVIKPQPPYLLTYTFKGVPPTALKPTHYTEHSSVILADVQCALVLDSHFRVLGSIDAGNAK